MAAPTPSSKPARNGSARASLLAGLVGLAALPGAIALAQLSAPVELLDAGWGIPVALVFGLLALWLARRARTRTERTLGRVGGVRTARTGKVFGALGIALGLAGTIALGFYWYLEHVA